MSDAYERLAALAESELELVTAGAFDDLPAVIEERDAIVAVLPDVPPDAARPALVRAAQLQERTTAVLARTLRELGGELGRLERGRSTVRRYGAGAAPAGRRVNHAA